jgi:leader peptidase (prepilin peptidase)/N-methyltransferase
MDWADSSHLAAAVTCLVLCLVLGAFGTPLIARLPEPEPDPEVAPEPEGSGRTRSEADALVEPEAVDQADRALFARTLPARPPKEPYADIAALPGLALRVAAWSGVIGAGYGLALGWTGALVYLVPFVPIGVVLMVIDWRTTLLPNSVIFPTYAVVLVLIPLAGLVDQDAHALFRAGWGWLVIGGWFWVFWFLAGAWGYGDVRLAGLLGPVLGYLGWPHVLIGLALIVFIGGIGGLVLGLVRRNLRARVPYGPAMLLGAGFAVPFAPWLAQSLGY